jgi:hypothetical protein
MDQLLYLLKGTDLTADVEKIWVSNKNLNKIIKSRSTTKYERFLHYVLG